MGTGVPQPKAGNNFGEDIRFTPEWVLAARSWVERARRSGGRGRELLVTSPTLSSAAGRSICIRNELECGLGVW